MESVPFTSIFSKPVVCISCKCKVSAPYDAAYDTRQHPEFVECDAIWDTGAMRTTISRDLATRLGIKPLGQTKVFHADGESICNYYIFNVLLPNRIEIKLLMINDGKMKDIDMLIGMDIISMCDFALTSNKENTKFSFQIPGKYDIDFTKIQT